MEFCKIKNPPEYTLNVEKWTKRTRDNGEEMSVPIEQIVNNTFYNKVMLEQYKSIIDVPLFASEWSNVAPYQQRISIPGIKGTDNPIIGMCTPKDLPPSTIKNYRKMTALITEVETEENYITFYCGEKRPSADFKVRVKGVGANG